jgi:cobalt-zinc-cadmium efflux system outer membrane protein
MFARALHTVIVCVLSSIAGNVTAQPPQSAPAAVQLTLADTVEMALARNPDLAASRYELTAARGRITQADLRPNPELDLELENFAGGGDLGGTDALETTLALSSATSAISEELSRKPIATSC